jgi:hypothetical protein
MAEKRSPKRLPFSSIKGSENYGYLWILFVFGRIMQSRLMHKTGTKYENRRK